MSDLTRSPIENIFTKISQKLSPKIYNLPLEKPIDPNAITSLGVIAMIYSIYSLNENKILSCIFFAFIAQYLDNLDGYYAKKYNLDTTIGKYYDHLADNIKILGLIFVFYILYENKITVYHIIFFIILSLIGNINYAIRIRLKDINNENFDYHLKPYNYLGKLFGSKENLIYLSKITRFFDDTSIFCYYLITIIYFQFI